MEKTLKFCIYVGEPKFGVESAKEKIYGRETGMGGCLLCSGYRYFVNLQVSYYFCEELDGIMAGSAGCG